jgi:hypothetical protein
MDNSIIAIISVGCFILIIIGVFAIIKFIEHIKSFLAYLASIFGIVYIANDFTNHIINDTSNNSNINERSADAGEPPDIDFKDTID